MPRPEFGPQGSTVPKTRPPVRQPYSLPKPFAKKATPEGYGIFAANGNEVMLFRAVSNTTDFPEGRTLEEASQHADRMLDILMEGPGPRIHN